LRSLVQIRFAVWRALFVATLALGISSSRATPLIGTPPLGLQVISGLDATFTVVVVDLLPVTYQWRKNGTPIPGETNALLTIHHAQASDNGQYSVTVRDTLGSTTSANALLVVLVPPLIDSLTPSQQILGGSNITLSVSVSGTAPFAFQWFFNNAAIPGATNQSLGLQDVTTKNTGDYFVLVSNAAGTNQSQVTTITVVLPPLITGKLQDQTAPAGGSTSFDAQVQGSQPMFFQWFTNGVPIPGATNSSYGLPVVRLRDQGFYSYVASNAYGVATSEVAQLAVQILPLLFADNFADATNMSRVYYAGLGSNAGATIELCEPLHDGVSTSHSMWLAWTAPGTGIVTLNTIGSTFDTVLAVYTGNTLTGLTPVESDDDSGGGVASLLQFDATQGVTYYIALAGHGQDSGMALFELDFLATADLLPKILRHPQSIALLQGQPAALDFAFSATDPNVQVQWLFENRLLASATTTTNDLGPATEDLVGRYRAVVITPTRTNFSHWAELQINSRGLTNVLALDKLPDAISSGLVALNVGATQVFGTGVGAGGRGGGGGGGGSGSRGYSTTQIFSTVGATSDPGEPVHCGIGAGHSEWYAYQAEMSGTIKIDTDGSSFDTVLAVYIGPGDSYSTLTNVACDNDSGLDGHDSMVRFQATAGTTYYIAVDGVSNASPQTGTVRLHINLGNPVTIVAQPQSQSATNGSNVTFTVAADGMTNYTYQWRFNGSPIATATNAFLSGSAIPSRAGSYDAVVNNPLSSATSQVAVLTVLSPTLSITTQPSSQTVNTGSNATFNVVATGSGSLRYQWRWNGGNLSGATNSSLLLTNVQPGSAGTYDVIVADVNGSQPSAAAVLTVVARPIITQQPSSQTAPAGGTVTLVAGASGTPAPSVQWLFNSVPLPGATAASLVLTDFQSANEGGYSMLASNSAGTALSAVAQLFVNGPLRMTNLCRSNGITSLRIIGEASSNYVVQATTNFAQWFNVGTNAPPSGIWDFSDPSSNSINRFYRAVKP